MHRPWNYNSGIACCDECNGHGVVASYRMPTINDPYPEQACECGRGEHAPECDVCGFDVQIAGFDCLACDTVAALTDDEIASFDVDKFAKALRSALGAAVKVDA